MVQTIQLADIPPARRPGKGSMGQRRRLLDPRRPFSRRSFVKATAAVGMGLGLSTVAAIPIARRANAHHKDEYDMFLNGFMDYCPDGDDWYDNHGNSCDVPCGPSEVYPWACVEDAGPDFHWHKDHSYPNNWALRPNVCATEDESPDTSDAWRWKVNQSCGGCSNSALFRCHDGFKNYQQFGHDKSICKAIIECNPGGAN